MINMFKDRRPDVEAIFEFNYTKTRSVQSGYRPAHLVKEDYLTSGEHCYYEVERVAPGETAKGTITFISPESYPHCLWIGKKITLQEGAHIVGYAIITDIYNPILKAEQEKTTNQRTQGDGSSVFK